MPNWERLARAETHPLRIKLLEAIERASKPCSPKELANTYGVSVPLASYHVTELKKAGMVELDRTEPRRGCTQHFYRKAA